jgi:hypothetical protein
MVSAEKWVLETAGGFNERDGRETTHHAQACGSNPGAGWVLWLQPKVFRSQGIHERPVSGEQLFNVEV